MRENTSATQHTTPARRGNRRRFVKWMKAYGISRLARDVNTTRNTVHNWIRGVGGKQIAPSHAFMAQVVELSMREPFDFGPVTFEDMMDGTEGFRGQSGTGYRLQRPAHAKAGA